MGDRKHDRMRCLGQWLFRGILIAGASSCAFAEEDPLAVAAALTHSWDSNYSREPNPEPEQVTVASVDATLQKAISRQVFSAQWGVANYQHRHQDALDASIYRAGAKWRGFMGEKTRFLLAWSRQDRLADQIDFDGKDIITLDRREAEAGYIIHPRWEILGEVNNTLQKHSNDARDSLDFEEHEFGVALRYQSGRNSTVLFQLTEGERDYADRFRGTPGEAGADLNFRYDRAELEVGWAATDKSLVTGQLGYFERDGEVNEGSGTEARLRFEWQASEKTALTLGYLFQQPPVGEDSYDPSESQQANMAVEWQWTPKLRLATTFRGARQEFDGLTSRKQRNETVYVWAPLIVDYYVTEDITVQIVTSWQERDSAIPWRDYVARELELGVEMQL